LKLLQSLLSGLQFTLVALELPPDPRERHFWSRLATLQLVYSLAGLVLGLVCVIGGIMLFFHGVAGTSSWVGEVIGVKSKLSDAAPGTVLFVVGLAVVFLTRFTVRVRRPIEIDLSDRRDLPDRRRRAG